MNYSAGRNALCDRCGFKFKATQLRKEWTGLRVCSGPDTNNCFEDRHPQDFLRGKVDRQTPPWVRPDPEPTFLTSRVWNEDTKAWEDA